MTQLRGWRQIHARVLYLKGKVEGLVNDEWSRIFTKCRVSSTIYSVCVLDLCSAWRIELHAAAAVTSRGISLSLIQTIPRVSIVTLTLNIEFCNPLIETLFLRSYKKFLKLLRLYVYNLSCKALPRVKCLKILRYSHGCGILAHWRSIYVIIKVNKL